MAVSVPPTRGWSGRLRGALVASVLVVTACASGPGASPGPPSAYLGTVVDTPVPASVADLPLTTDAGQATSLAAWHGQVVVLTDFLTLCQAARLVAWPASVVSGRSATEAGTGVSTTVPR